MPISNVHVTISGRTDLSLISPLSDNSFGMRNLQTDFPLRDQFACSIKARHCGEPCRVRLRPHTGRIRGDRGRTRSSFIPRSIPKAKRPGSWLPTRVWEAYPATETHLPQFRLGRTLEGIAQFYTYKLLEWLDDPKLLDAFTKLEGRSDPIYRGWRDVKHLSLEAMRKVLMHLRDAESEWPPTRL